MKLVRFHLLSDPESIRAGFVHQGRVYETDGTSPIAVHDWADTQLLAPIGKPNSVRFVPSGFGVGGGQAGFDSEDSGPQFLYLNPGSVVGSHSNLLLDDEFGGVSLKCCLALAVAEAGMNLDPGQALGCAIGFAMALVAYSPELERRELASGLGLSRSHDFAIPVGPALTSPDEMSDDLGPEGDFVAPFACTLSLNGADVAVFDSTDGPASLPSIVSFASQTAPIRAGDLFLVELGPTRQGLRIEPGDEIRWTSDRLGSLALRRI